MESTDELVVCEACGVVHDAATQALAFKERAIRDLEAELRVKRAQISKLRGEAAEQQGLDPVAADARKVFDYWRKKLSPRAREFSGDRFDKVAARLKAGADVAELQRAIDGAARLPYVTDNGRKATGRPAERQVELALICRSEAHVHRFQSYAADAEPAKAEPREPVSAATLERWQQALRRPHVMERLRALRGWSDDAMVELGLGLDGERVIFPVRSGDGKLVGLCRYQPNPERRRGQPKQLAVGPRDLFPAPESIEASSVWLVEGEADAVAMRSIGYRAVGLPGVATWRDEWAARFAHFDRVYICLDCDEQGREAAEQRLSALGAVAHASIVDIDPDRADGFDVTDLLLAEGEGAASKLSGLTTGRSVAPLQPRLQASAGERPVDRVVRALERADCRVRERGGDNWQAQCPHHDDREPSLSISEGEDGRALLKCHAGCETAEVLDALGLEARELFWEAAR